MQLHTLQRKHPLKKDRPRVGRGGKRGSYSGRGVKGQKAHAGRRIPSGLKEILSRLPKLRGVKNKSIQEKPEVVNLGDLGKIPGEINIINKNVLAEHGLIKDARNRVKILGNGYIKKPVTLQGLMISQSAKKKIEVAGGTVKNLEARK